MSDPEIIIIGAGPAGCVAAILLARAGKRVSIVEQHRFPRDKVCGECLSALGIEVLQRLGLDRTIAALGATTFHRAELIAPSGEIATIDLPRPMWGVSRLAMDSALLDAAREAGTTILQPARFEDGFIRDLVTNIRTPVPTALIVRADGKAEHVTTTDLGVKAHFEGVHGDAQTISLFGLRGHYVGIAPIENQRWNLAMSVPTERVRAFHGNLDALFAEVQRENVELNCRLRLSARVTEWITSPLPRFPVAPAWRKGEIPIGNAAAALEPIGGEGMGLAMRSAELATSAILSGAPIDLEKLRREYNKLWRIRRFAARATAMFMSSPRCAEIVVSAINSSEAFARPALAPLGKS